MKQVRKRFIPGKMRHCKISLNSFTDKFHLGMVYTVFKICRLLLFNKFVNKFPPITATWHKTIALDKIVASIFAPPK